jgi:hypothetical protein
MYLSQIAEYNIVDVEVSLDTTVKLCVVYVGIYM